MSTLNGSVEMDVGGCSAWIVTTGKSSDFSHQSWEFGMGVIGWKRLYSPPIFLLWLYHLLKTTCNYIKKGTIRKLCHLPDSVQSLISIEVVVAEIITSVQDGLFNFVWRLYSPPLPRSNRDLRRFSKAFRSKSGYSGSSGFCATNDTATAKIGCSHVQGHAIAPPLALAPESPECRKKTSEELR